MTLPSKALQFSLGALLTLSASAAAMADGDKHSALMSWAKDASVAVDDVMYFPHYTRGGIAEGQAEFRVTIDEDGDVIASEMTKKPNNIYIRRAAKSVVSKVDLPDLPSGYDKLTFALRLNYYEVSSAREARQLQRQPRVTTRRIASSAAAPMTAGIKVISVTYSGD